MSELHRVLHHIGCGVMGTGGCTCGGIKIAEPDEDPREVGYQAPAGPCTCIFIGVGDDGPEVSTWGCAVHGGKSAQAGRPDTEG